jgi:hypothetical protein
VLYYNKRVNSFFLFIWAGCLRSVKYLCCDKSKENRYERQETTIFLDEFLGDASKLAPLDNEIGDLRFQKKEKVIEMLTHSGQRITLLNFKKSGRGRERNYEYCPNKKCIV